MRSETERSICCCRRMVRIPSLFQFHTTLPCNVGKKALDSREFHRLQSVLAWRLRQSSLKSAILLRTEETRSPKFSPSRLSGMETFTLRVAMSSASWGSH